MKKKLLAFICVFTMAFSLFGVMGCNSEGGLFGPDQPEIIEVSSLEEIKNNSGKQVKLTANIDCGGETVSGIYVSGLDGNGFTISNCTISTSKYNVPASFLGHQAQTVKNVTFDNITVSSSQASGAAIVSSGNASLIENVHVKNSTVTATQIDKNSKKCYYGIIFGGSYSTNSNAPLENIECVIKDCSVTNCNIEIMGEQNSTANMYVGGICGVAKEVVNCKVSGTNITAHSKGTTSMASAGGAIGLACGKVEKVAVDSCVVKAQNTMYWQGSTGIVTGGDARVGGVVAVGNENFNATKSYAKTVTIVGKATADIYAGGFGGRITKGSISECYCIGTSLHVDGYKKNNMNNDVQRNIGGFAGEIKDCTVTSSFAHNYNTGTIKDDSEFDNRCEHRTGGFAGKITSATISKCATAMGSTLQLASIDTKDEFTLTKSGVSNCYITATNNAPTYRNNADCTIVDTTFWSTEAIASLGLTGSEWSYVNNLPQLNLG